MNVSSFFQGSALKFSVAGEGVSIDPTTGGLGLSAEALRTGITVTVTALPPERSPGAIVQAEDRHGGSRPGAADAADAGGQRPHRGGARGFARHLGRRARARTCAAVAA